MKKRRPSKRVRKEKKDKPKKQFNLIAIALLLLGVVVTSLMVYVLVAESNQDRTNRKFAFRWPFTSEKISDNQLREAVAKFPETHRVLQSVKNRIEAEGYQFRSPLIDYVLLKNLCLSIIPDQNKKEKIKSDCLDFQLLSQEVGEISPATKQAWARTIYRAEYDRNQELTIDGIIDDREGRTLQEETVATLDKDFSKITRGKIVSLLADIRSTDDLVPDELIQKRLETILKINPSTAENTTTNRDKKARNIARVNAQAEWINRIYDFQIAHGLPAAKIEYGVIASAQDPTYEKLKQAIINDIKVPFVTMERARSQFAQTRQGIDGAIRSIYKNVVSDPKLKTHLKNRYPDIFEQSSSEKKLNIQLEADIQEKIYQFLGVRVHTLDFDFLVTIEQPLQVQEERWTTAIYRYQKYQLNQKNPDGTMFPGSPMNRDMIATITKQLKEELQYY
jgi:hypothetical protein